MRELCLYSLLALAGLNTFGCAQITPLQSEDVPAGDRVSIPMPEPSIVPQDDTPPIAPEADAPIWQILADGSGQKHLASGFICPAEQGSFRLTREEAFAGLGRGNDVSCIYWASEGGVVRLHLTRFGRDVSPSAHLKGVRTQISDTQKIIMPAPLPPLSANTAIDHTAAYQIATQSALRPDVPVHTAVWIRQTGAWHVKARATYEADRAVQVGALVSALFISAERDISRTPNTTPPSR